MARTGRWSYLDGIRAVAIGCVLALHWLSWYSPLFHGGSVGVDVFFVLSGFIITTMLWRQPLVGTAGAGWIAFVRRRVVRLYPALLGLAAGAVLLYAVVPTAPLPAVEVARRAGLALAQTSSVWAALQHGGLWVTHLHPFGQTWSLAVEWYFYLLWPFAVLGARRRCWPARRLAFAALAATVVLYGGSLGLGTFWFYFGPSARFGEILAGAALALWFQARGVPTAPLRFSTPASAAALAAIACYALLGSDGDTALYRWVGVPVAVLATLVLIRNGYGDRGSPVSRLLGHPWLAAVGRHSYSLYLWHLLPLLLLRSATSIPKPVAGLLAVAATVVLTVLSYRFLEQPFLRPRSDVLQPRRPLRPKTQDAPLGQRGDEVLS